MYQAKVAIEQADDPGTIEISAEGGLGISTQPINFEAVPIAPTVEQPIKEAPTLLQGATHSALDTGQLGTKWYNFKTIEIKGNPTVEWTHLSINPFSAASLRKPGESISLPWRRNVWTTGSNENGYIVQLVIQANVPRPPQISGILEIIDSGLASSRYLVSFGTRVEIPIMIQNLAGEYKSTTRPRFWSNPWVKTDESINLCRYRLIAINRTADISNIKVSIQLRVGYSRFNVTRKPFSTGTTTLDDVLDTLRVVMQNTVSWGQFLKETLHKVDLPRTQPSPQVKPVEQAKPWLGKELSNGFYMGDDNEWHKLPENWQEEADFAESGHPSASEFITPFIGDRPEAYTVQDDIGQDEEINLDDFPIMVFDGHIDLQDGESDIFNIVLNLPNIPDKLEYNPENPITQKFERFANIIPKIKGGYGPVIGTYTFNFRLPTTAAGTVEHVCIPGDMSEEVAVRLFALSSLASLAGTAFSAIGGPLINGVVNTAAPLISGVTHALGGKVAGTLADTAISAVKGVANAVSLSPAQTAIQGSAPNAIAGDIPISRFVQFVKYVKDNFERDPVFPILTIKLRQFYEDGKLKTGQLPLSVFLSMKDSIKIERNIFDRSIYPLADDYEPDLWIPIDRIPYVLETFIRHDNTFKKDTVQSRNFIKFIKLIDEQLNTNLRTKGRINISAVLRIRDDLVKTLDPNEYFRQSKLFRMCNINAKSSI